MAKTGRPKKVIDQKQFETLCGIQCTENEICAVLGVTDKTLNTWCRRTYKMTFSDIFAQKRDYGKASLRRMQYKLAESGNATMLIWLGRQWLGQAEKQSKPDDDEDEFQDEIEDLLKDLD